MLQSDTTTAAASQLAPLVNLVQPWQSLYAGHTWVATLVMFVHLSALVCAAGMAITNDRWIVRSASTEGDERVRRLSDLSSSHRFVLGALSLSFASGVLLLLADLEAFVVMPAFWVKISLILLLTLNAFLMMRREQQLRLLDVSAVPISPAHNKKLWTRLRRHAYTSVVLWFAIVLAGTAMTSG